MDWIDVQLEKMKLRIQNYSLIRAAMCYLCLFGGAAMVLAAITIRICDRQISMWIDGNLQLSAAEIRMWNFLSHWCAYFYLAAGMILMLKLFYKNRLKTPLEILKNGVEEIQKQNLQFSLEYSGKDEMGELCASFDSMRRNLIENYEYIWKLVEEQKQLNAAFAHDLRTPLTVLKGYSEFLSRYLPQGKISQEKMTDILELMTKQLDRLTLFSKTMKEVRSLDEYPVEKEKQEIFHLYKAMEGILEALNLGGDIRLSIEPFPYEKQQEKGMIDENVILEVLDNLLSNAIRFARSSIHVTLEPMREAEGYYLFLYVEDDGPGFSEISLAKAVKPYYGDTQEGDHFGIELHICSMLCRAHGGRFSIANKMLGNGAVISASFLIS